MGELIKVRKNKKRESNPNGFTHSNTITLSEYLERKLEREEKKALHSANQRESYARINRIEWQLQKINRLMQELRGGE